MKEPLQPLQPSAVSNAVSWLFFSGIFVILGQHSIKELEELTRIISTEFNSHRKGNHK